MGMEKLLMLVVFAGMIFTGLALTFNDAAQKTGQAEAKATEIINTDQAASQVGQIQENLEKATSPDLDPLSQGVAISTAIFQAGVLVFLTPLIIMSGISNIVGLLAGMIPPYILIPVTLITLIYVVLSVLRFGRADV